MRRFLLIFISLTLLSCRKERFQRPNYSYTPPPDSWRSFRPLTFGPDANIFLANTLTSDRDSTHAPKISAAAYFSDSVTYGFNSTLGVAIADVQLNGKSLSFSDRYYLDTTVTQTSWMNWHLQGSGNFPTCTLANSDPYPSCPDFYSLPDTISKSIAIVKYLTRLSNVDTAMLLLDAGNKGIGAMFSQKKNKLFLSIPLLQMLPSNQMADMYLICSKNNLVLYGNKLVCLSANHVYRKQVFIAP